MPFEEKAYREGYDEIRRHIKIKEQSISKRAKIILGAIHGSFVLVLLYEAFR
jgi:hypothetical protein